MSFQKLVLITRFKKPWEISTVSSVIKVNKCFASISLHIHLCINLILERSEFRHFACYRLLRFIKSINFQAKNTHVMKYQPSLVT